MMHLVPTILRQRPCIPELDFAGDLVAVGSAVAESRTELQVGTRVFGSVPVGAHLRLGAGALAEFVAIDAATVVPCPPAMPLRKAAGLGVAGCAALVLLQAARLVGGEKVLVNGASGGIGSMVVQLARSAVGEHGLVVGVCSGAGRDMVLALGADEVRYSKPLRLHSVRALFGT